VLALAAERSAPGLLRLRWPAPVGDVDLLQADQLEGPWRSVHGFPRRAPGPIDEANVPAAEASTWFKLVRR
jgi:hypothetical protein